MNKEILLLLTDEWKSTSVLIKESDYRYHYYKLLSDLKEACHQGLVENCIKGKRKQINLWRLPEKPQGDSGSRETPAPSSQSIKEGSE